MHPYFRRFPEAVFFFAGPILATSSSPQPRPPGVEASRPAPPGRSGKLPALLSRDARTPPGQAPGRAPAFSSRRVAPAAGHEGACVSPDGGQQTWDARQNQKPESGTEGGEEQRQQRLQKQQKRTAAAIVAQQENAVWKKILLLALNFKLIQAILRVVPPMCRWGVTLGYFFGQ